MDYQKEFLKKVYAHIKKSGRNIEILAVAGPNGAGKTTLIRWLMQKFPDFFCEVTQVTTRPICEYDQSRKYLSLEQFNKKKVILWGQAGVYQYWYTAEDLMSAFKKDKIIIFEGISRVKKLQLLLGDTYLKYMIVGILPPGKNMSAMIKELRRRLLMRCFLSEEDVQKKLFDAEFRVIPQVLRESDIIIRSEGNETHADVSLVMKKWKEMIK